ncbi:complement C1q and tumor necrosis factor-related protein 9A-like [Acanthaster planci]|uniref:Complement C1q and tumor necrosis factor-related protein 9A-like n=1 Tax=Acanthaster planci TaxID=133434 RepID=A0A8B7Z3Y4_ACAPL|nr:complement C1q and tumor necrosis factor-related protein 9A-like [Acanthaster planci]
MKICFATALSIVILLGNCIKLRAAITGPAPAESDSPGSQVCSMCCQGPAGTPGIPGLPGNQGNAGSPGLYGPTGSKGDAGEPGAKGEVGLAGAMGERGAPGNPGPKGDDGISLPGKIGPRGPPGLGGPKGASGVKGQKGELGEAGEALETPRVAFTVTRTTSSAASSSYNTRLQFQETETLLPGTSFDLESGAFSCNVSGTYVFMFSVRKQNPSSDLHVKLWKNGVVIVTGVSTDSSHYEQVSGSAVLVLQQGDSVYVTMKGTAYSDSDHETSFSGFLLYAK